MASMVAPASSGCSSRSQVSSSLTVQQKGSRNKRKFRADPPLGDMNKIVSLPQTQSDSSSTSEVGPSRPREEVEADEFHDADWSDLTEAQLEELVISNLDTIFRSAIKKFVACGYTEEVATKAVLRSGHCYGSKDTVSNIVDSTLAFLRSGQEIDPSREHCFDDLRQLEEYVLAELVCVLREVRPFFSTGDAMWCLLICDMNVSHACAMDASLKISKARGVDAPQEDGKNNLSTNAGPAFIVAPDLDNGNTISSPKIDTQLTLPEVDTTTALPPSSTHHALQVADTELSLSLSSKNNSAVVPMSSTMEAPNSSYAGIPYDKSLGQWVPRDRKDEMILKLVPRIKELQNQMQEWTEWANQKVMQAARRLSKDKEELKTLRQEKEEVKRLKKEKQTLEENTMKKLSEMENALCKASGQVERANSAVRKLEVENALLRQEMEGAKLRAAESAANCQEVSKREKKTLMEFQSWEKQKAFLQEELAAEKRKLTQLLRELEQEKALQEQFEARWQQEEKAKEEILAQISSMKKEREQIEVSTKSKEDMIKLKAENNLQKYKDDIQKLEKEISQLRRETDSPKIAALRRGIDGSYAGKLTDIRNGQDRKQSRAPFTSEAVAGLQVFLETGGVKRERECVMCLSEEMSVVFLPCAHQVVCTTCNELHEKQGMKDCPSCRSPIQRRISVRYARS
ncbi:putative E3 ubiquitin-protein ligase RF298 isoform X2 [Morus notabilis]|uniref:putative E3 ubiquitin-protein ligase RF298 isoform X2 n=1 Tax=Morus notabilis TaxID=981085 RepID=UPI000CED64D4|nr:putative E3 ubiquitin-protein ligase RF298 isoform X2 [Morus notabilis]